MEEDFTLPELQARVDARGEGQLLWVRSVDCERLFGMNDAAAARFARFANGHGCHVSPASDGIHFRKKLVLEAP